MIHLAKCTPTKYDIHNIPKLTGASGIEFILLPRFTSKARINESIKVIEHAARNPSIKAIGLELNEGIPKGYRKLDDLMLFNPISLDENRKNRSREFLNDIAYKFTRPLKKYDKKGYFQFQAVGDPIRTGEQPSKVDKDRIIKELSEYVNELKENTETEIMMENQNRVCLCATSQDVIYNTKIGCNLSDWKKLTFPMILDVAHLSLDNYTIAQAILYPRGVHTSKGKFFVEADESEKIEIGYKLAPYIQNNDREKIRRVMTDIIIEQMRKYAKKIGALHIDNAGFNGIEIHHYEGLSSLVSGTMYLNEIIKTAVDINPRYIVVETEEVDFTNPINQIAVSKTIKELMKK